MLTEPARGAFVAEGSGNTGTGWLVRRAALIYVAIAVVLTAVAALAVNLPDAHETLEFDGNEVVGGWCRYDCTWYREIADHGYFYIEGEQSSVAFFPGYPLVARVRSRGRSTTRRSH